MPFMEKSKKYWGLKPISAILDLLYNQQGQKGRVENSNGRLRLDFPRKINLKQLSQDDFTESIENYNLIPRKSLDWDTPYHLFQENLIGVALQT